uniref:Uncharacterized protein n=1 Tax=Dictyoglomus turgidum TaxID=513050 RepID=A0A7C3WP24_9BACT
MKKLVILFLVSCCPIVARSVPLSYDTDHVKTVKTPKGVTVALNGNQVDDNWFNIVDSVIEETAKCVHEVYPRKTIPKMSCWKIYVPEDWRLSCKTDAEGNKYQLFGIVPHEACALKGFEEDPNCPCGLRVAVTNKNWIVVPPDLRLLRAGVVELMTGWLPYYIWQDRNLAKCLSEIKVSNSL